MFGWGKEKWVGRKGEDERKMEGWKMIFQSIKVFKKKKKTEAQLIEKKVLIDQDQSFAFSFEISTWFWERKKIKISGPRGKILTPPPSLFSFLSFIPPSKQKKKKKLLEMEFYIRKSFTCQNNLELEINYCEMPLGISEFFFYKYFKMNFLFIVIEIFSNMNLLILK